MKGIAGVAFAAAVATGVAAQPHAHGHGHQHLHRHANRHAEIEKRDTVVVTEFVKGPTITEYVLDGKKVDEKKAKDGIKKGLYVVMGTSTPTFVAPPPAISTSTAPGPKAKGGQFFEDKTSSSAPPPVPSEPPKPKPSAPSVAANIDADFPSGTISCDKLPTEYGPEPVPWENLGGWTTIMSVGSWIKGLSFDNIHQGKGRGCKAGDMCSYACPPGYQKSQWPEGEQGATGQSVGGLFCNQDGKLELTRPSHPKLCEKGAGGVFVRNELTKNSAICRTDYPGNEAMTIPVDTYPGQTYELTNPVSSEYYVWQGKPTTAQYYINNEGVSKEQACTWDSSLFPDSAGNWAPMNIGVGKDSHGITYLSLFQNLPTSHAKLNFNIEIEGTYSGECWYRNGEYAKPNGCTVC